MANKNIEESLSEAKNYLNGVETDGEASINIADRILGSCKVFVHPPHLKDLLDYEQKINIDFEEKWNEAKQKNMKEKDDSLKYYNLAQFFINLRIAKTMDWINFLDRLNQKL